MTHSAQRQITDNVLQMDIPYAFDFHTALGFATI